MVELLPRLFYNYHSICCRRLWSYSTQHPSTLGYIAAAVKVFVGNNPTVLSRFLVPHVTTILTRHVTTVHAQDDSSNLLQAYFECLNTTLHFVLVTNPQLFATIISLAVQCLTVFRTWRKRIDSRRLVWFLSQLFGLARVAIGKSSQSGISKYQHHRSR
jgi:hypothetical protein